MVVEDDIITLKTKDKWIVPAVKYAEKSWPCTFNRMGKANIYERMRNIVKGIIVQQAFEDKLKECKIKYETKDRRKWYEIDRYDIYINGKKYDIKTNWIDSIPNKKWLLDCSALVPTDQVYSRTLSDDDIYIFCFITGKIHNLNGYNPKEVLAKPCFDKDGMWILHGFWDYEFLKPPKWIKAQGCKDLGHVLLKSTSRSDVGKSFILGGTRVQKEFQFEEITLDNKREAVTTREFFQLFFIRPLDNNIPEGKIIIQTERGKVKEVINPRGGFMTERREKQLQLLQNDWDDIWIYNSVIYMVGYMTKGEFKEKSEEIKRFDKTVKQFEIKTDNNRLFVSQLHPISDLFPELILSKGGR
jgi:hypothetical protein